ncbi:anthranilate synthase component I [Anaerotalea alkaliphila]|uniref:Anthranilate synthase component 1 n=1 Tax=Anaerotalea alkaliphila TaxID=2662126 RepID=A0A7X5KME6_9FIRM|nr:anthranilate synthase component I [Anaerotalea alkaliphila]NDL67729.1 anthranilate synthase component I [Anaerotalea alkaliphila]
MDKMVLKVYEEKIFGDVETPITLYKKYVRNSTGFLLESKEQPKGRYSFLAANPFLEIRAYGNQVQIYKEDVRGVLDKSQVEVREGKALDFVKEEIERYEIRNTTSIPFVGGAVGTVGYDMIKQYEKIPQENLDSVGTPDLHLLFIRELVVYDHYHHMIHLLVLEEENDAGAKKAEEKLADLHRMLKKDVLIEGESSQPPLQFQSNVSRKTFMDAVEKAKDYIYEGDIFQVVLSQRWSARTDLDPFSMYRKLRRVNPSPYLYYFNMGDYQIVGSSPEMLVDLRSGTIQTCPIAGTRRRGRSTEEDQELAKELLADPKERAEHVMLVDLGRNDMGKVSQIGSVHVKQFMEVQNYSHVMHIVSLVEGEKREDKDMFEVLMSFLPAGTLSGAPKIRAMEIIEELEISKRGIYGGAIGYFGFNGNMDMCIAIRTIVVKDGVVHIQSGAGIVADSEPEAEYEETVNKAKAMMAAINQ